LTCSGSGVENVKGIRYSHECTERDRSRTFFD